MKSISLRITDYLSVKAWRVTPSLCVHKAVNYGHKGLWVVAVIALGYRVGCRDTKTRREAIAKAIRIERKIGPLDNGTAEQLRRRAVKQSGFRTRSKLENWLNKL